MAGSFARYWHGEPQRLPAIELRLLPQDSPSQHNGLADKRQWLVILRDFVRLKTGLAHSRCPGRYSATSDLPSVADCYSTVRVGRNVPRANLALIDRSARSRAVPLAIQEAGDRPA